MKKLIKLLKNFKFLISYCIAYILLHGWCYVFIAIGWIFDINWMYASGLSWFTILWLPNGVCIATTVPVAIFVHWIIFKEIINWNEKTKRKERIILKRCLEK